MDKKKDKLPPVPPKSRNMDKDLLMSNYSKAEMTSIRHNFTPAEIAGMKDEFFQVSSCRTAREELVKTIKSLLDFDSGTLMEDLKSAIDLASGKMGQAGMKTLVPKFKELMKCINKGYEIREEMVYEIDYSDEGHLDYFDENGTFLYEIKSPNRHQLHILSNPQNKAVNEE